MSRDSQRDHWAEISVVIPARNAAATVSGTIASLATETDLIREIIVVDDASSDDTATQALRQAQLHGLRATILPVASEDAGAARNAGIAMATGRYIYFLDADDLHVSGGLRALHGCLQTAPRAGIAIGAFIREVAGVKTRYKRITGIGVVRARNVERLLADRLGSIAMGTVLLRREAIGKTRFPVGLAYDEDTLFWARILSTTDAVAINQKVLVYRVGQGRSDMRFVQGARAAFLRWLGAARRLQEDGIDRSAIKGRAATIAFKIARTHYARGDCGQSKRFIAVAQKLWRPDMGMLRLRRYVGRISRLCQRQPAGIEAAAAAAPAYALVIGVDPFASPISGVDLRNWQNACALAESGPVVIASLHPMPGSASRTSNPSIFATALSFDGEKHSASISRRHTYIDPRISRLALARLRTLVDRVRPGVVVIEGINLWPLLESLRPVVPQLILDMHNVESDLARTMKAGHRRSLFAAPDAERLRRRERSAADIVDRIWVSSDIDRERLRAFCPADRPIDIVPNGIPRLEALPRRPPAKQRGNGGKLNLLFVGHLGYAPNVHAATRLANRIVPHIRSSYPAVQLTIAGRAPHADIRALEALPFVRLIENPPGLGAIYSEADIAVVPLSEGGGTRIKILEAMAYGVPVVATAVAAEGLAFRDEEQILIADSDAQFVECIRSLAAADRYEILRQSAFDAVIARFGYEAIAEAVRKAVRP